MEKENFTYAMDLSNSINKLLVEAKRVLSYNLNVIDELHANENAHSRILCKILQYSDENGKFPFLQSFLDYIASEVTPSFGEIVIQNPKITQEQERIDLWIRDNSYAIIMENKVLGAADQDAQLERYINKTKSINHKYTDANIYVIYLPADSHEPSDNSWGEYKNSSIEQNNYANVSFQYTVLPWLKLYVQPSAHGSIMSAAIIQYIDYLEGFFRLRPSQQRAFHMDPKWLGQLGLEGDFSQQLPTINSMLQKLDEAKNVLINYRSEYIGNFIEQFTRISKEILSSKYGGSWQEKGAIYNCWFFLYNKHWNTSNLVHIEWSGISLEDLFVPDENLHYTIKLHVEGRYSSDDRFTSLLKRNLGDSYLPGGKTTFWQHSFSTQKPIGIMTSQELEAFLTQVYTTAPLEQVINAVEKTSKEYTNNIG